MQIVFQDPYSSLNPRMRARQIVEEPLDHPPARRRAARRERASPSCSGWSASIPAHLERYPAPVQRRPAAAHRPGARAGAQSVVPGARRAGLGARRLGAGAGRQPADRSAAAAEADLPVHRARPAAGRAHLQPRRGDVSGQDRRDRGRPRRCSTAPQHPYTRALLSAIPVPDPDAPRQRIVLDPASGQPQRRAAGNRRRALRGGLALASVVSRSPETQSPVAVPEIVVSRSPEISRQSQS